MCLKIVTNKFDTPNTRHGTGYKCGFVVENRFYPAMFNTGKGIPFGLWEVDLCSYDIAGSRDFYIYETGFHVFKNKKDAIRHWRGDPYPKNLSIVKVGYRNVTTEGKQDKLDVGKCVVAREIFIHKEVI